MSLPDCRRAFLAGVVAIVSAALAGCTVQPVYGTQGGASVTRAGALLPTVAVKPVETRYAQEVRNQLVFLLYGGAGEPAAPAYALDLGVTAVTRNTTRIQRVLDEEPTAGSVSLVSTYVLTENATGDVVARGRREAIASFDRTRQEFAAYRAERDAQNRAARELAEQVNLAVAQDLERVLK